MAVQHKACVPGLIGRHQQAEDHSFPTKCLEYRRCGVAMDTGIEHLVNQRIPPQSIKEPLGTIIVSLFARVLMVGRTVAAFFLSFFGGLNQTTRFIQQAYAVVSEQDEFPVGFFPKGDDDGLFPMTLLGWPRPVIELCTCRLYNGCSKQSMVPVIPQVFEGI